MRGQSLASCVDPDLAGQVAIEPHAGKVDLPAEFDFDIRIERNPGNRILRFFFLTENHFVLADLDRTFGKLFQFDVCLRNRQGTADLTLIGSQALR